MDKSVVHRMLAALTRHQFLERDPKTRKYRVGLRAWEIGRRYSARSWVDDVAVPLLAEWSSGPGARATSARWMAPRSSTSRQSTVRGHPRPRRGRFAHERAPDGTWAGDAGRGWMLRNRRRIHRVDFTRGRRDRGSPGRARPSRRPAGRDQGARLCDQPRRVRRGVGAVGAAIKDGGGRPIGAISVGFPIMSEYESLWTQLPPEVTRIATEISRRIG